MQKNDFPNEKTAWKKKIRAFQYKRKICFNLLKKIEIFLTSCRWFLDKKENVRHIKILRSIERKSLLSSSIEEEGIAMDKLSCSMDNLDYPLLHHL